MRIHFDFANQRISLEGDGPEIFQIMEVAREIAPKLPKLEITTHASLGQSPLTGHADSESNGSEPPKGGNGTNRTLRQFARSIVLTSLMDRIAAVAYYQKHFENKETFSPKEMNDWFVQCGFQKPAHMSVALSDAKRKYGYVENVGHASWRISTQGENLIIGKLHETTNGDAD